MTTDVIEAAPEQDQTAERPVETPTDPEVLAQVDALALVPTQRDFTPEQKALLEARGIKVTDIKPAMMQGFLLLCLARGVNPFIGEATVMPTSDGWAAILQIDGYRTIAERTGEYEGRTKPEWCDEDSNWYDAWPKGLGRPFGARVGVYRRGHREADYAVVYTHEVEVYRRVPRKGQPGYYDEELTERWADGGQALFLVAKCLPGGAMLDTDRGRMPIRQIVDGRLPVKVRSVDVETGREVWSRVTNWWENGYTNRWVVLNIPTGERGKGIRLTEEHPVWTPDGWRSAGEITAGDLVGVASPSLTPEQHQVLLGGLLGDGCLIRGAYTEAHSVRQEDYLLWKARALANLTPTVTHPKRSDGAGGKHDTVWMRTKKLPVLWQYGEQKPADRLADLGDLGLAVWIMDDGNLKRDRWQGRLVGRPHLRLYCCGFGTDFADQAALWFEQRYGVRPKVSRREKNPYLSFGTEVTARILGAIGSFLRYDPEINDKRWVADEVAPGPADGIAFVPVKEARLDVRRLRERRYDIEVEGTHAFVYRNVILHNCAEAAAFRIAFPRELDGFYTKEEMERANRLRQENEARRAAEEARAARREAYEEAQRAQGKPERHEVVEDVQEGVVVSHHGDTMDAVSRLRGSAQAAAPAPPESGGVEEVAAPVAEAPTAEAPADLALDEDTRVACLRAELEEQAAILGTTAEKMTKRFAMIYEGDPPSTWDSTILLSIAAFWRPRVVNRLRDLSRYSEAQAYRLVGGEYVDWPDVLFGRLVQPVGDGS